MNPPAQLPMELREGGVLQSTVAVRSFLIILLNDLFQVLLPVIAPVTLGIDGANESSIVQDIDWLFGPGKCYIFSQVKMYYGTRKSASTPHPITVLNPSSSASLQQNLSVPIEIDIEDEEDMLASIIGQIPLSSRETFLTDKRWRLLAGLQVSAAAQFMKQLEAYVDSDPAVVSKLERSFRSTSSSRLSWFSTEGGHDNQVPFRIPIKLLFPPSYGGSNENEQGLTEDHKFARFVELVGKQTQRLLDSLLTPYSKSISSAEVNLILTYMHAVGVICGLAMNAAITVPMRPPKVFLETLFHPISPKFHQNQRWSSDLLISLVAHAFRWGIISVFPETTLLMFSPDQFLHLFCRSTVDEALQR